MCLFDKCDGNYAYIIKESIYILPIYNRLYNINFYCCRRILCCDATNKKKAFWKIIYIIIMYTCALCVTIFK